MIIPAGTIIYASHACDASVEEARAHAKAMSLTTEDCRMVRRSDMILLELRRPWDVAHKPGKG